MFAPAHHQAMRHVVPVRKALGVRTIFNFLGPLTNPAGAKRQLIGVVDPAYMERIAGALERLGARHALVVSGTDGVDELSICAETRVIEVTEDGHARLHGVARGRRASNEEATRTCWAAAPRRTPPSRAPCSRASMARAGRWSCSMPARR